MVMCLTRDRGVAGVSLTGGTALCPWARHLILYCIGSTQEDPSRHDRNNVDLEVKNQHKQTLVQ